MVPGRNAARTLESCLRSLIAIAEAPDSPLGPIIFVNDHSTDGSIEIAEELGVTVLASNSRGPGAARNVGWRAARTPVVWFVDADCTAEPHALEALLAHFDDSSVAAVGGTYLNGNEGSIVATLIHEELVTRHAEMPRRVDFLATFNVIYRRDVLGRLNGFDERFLKAQDAELSNRVLRAGYQLGFDRDSRVIHDHETRLISYLRTQRAQGYWRVWLYFVGSGKPEGDSYSSLLDHIQPPLGLLLLITLPLLFASVAGTALSLLLFVPLLVGTALLACQLPMTLAIVKRTGRPKLWLFAPFSFIRAIYRGLGMTHGMLSCLVRRPQRQGVQTEP